MAILPSPVLDLFMWLKAQFKTCVNLGVNMGSEWGSWGEYIEWANYSEFNDMNNQVNKKANDNVSQE